MKKIMIVIPLLFLLLPVSGQTSIGVSNGDTFTFNLVEWNNNYDSTDETVVTLEDEFDDDILNMQAGDTFTITIINNTLTKDEDDDNQILVEYSANGQTIEYYDWVGWGTFFVIPDWDTYRSEFSSSTTTTESGIEESISIIDTDTEFGIKVQSSYSYSYTDYSYSSTTDGELRYEKSTGVMTLFKSNRHSTDVSASGTAEDTFNIEIVRSGFGNDTSGGVSLPGFEFLWVASLFLIPLTRKKY